MLFCFENGKVAKIDLASYATKLNRKKLTGGYSLSSQLIRMLHIKEDIDLAAFSNIGKVLVFNTENINPKTTRDSQGVNVLTSKKGSFMSAIQLIDEVNFADVGYYRTKNIPAVGCFIKDEDKSGNQLEMF